MDMFKKQKELEKGAELEKGIQGGAIGQGAMESPTYGDPTVKEPLEQETENTIMDQIVKNQVAIMKSLTQIAKQVDDFRKAWSTNQKAGKF